VYRVPCAMCHVPCAVCRVPRVPCAACARACAPVRVRPCVCARAFAPMRVRPCVCARACAPVRVRPCVCAHVCAPVSACVRPRGVGMLLFPWLCVCAATQVLDALLACAPDAPRATSCWARLGFGPANWIVSCRLHPHFQQYLIIASRLPCRLWLLSTQATTT
jgi:hypothetical protein